ncbi:DUF6610 family protein [Haloarcula nitratireducens]|uniref:Uncharacterized protein n=1 Tax=Haloarcula nitratireducens TaxID=2487749 RepID=A0AAW4PHS8_9EURY|nr:DUF6610 family protein [Halomicroarcula nitratireducens]MBX0297389.1 hypothetical protein [Halomicroarcula nitratireducens]
MSTDARHSWSAAAIDDAKQAEYVGFLHREPFVIDAYALGFAVGVREDYSYQSSLRNVDVPIEILDNDFRNPDLDRYIERFEQYEPAVGMLGDAYDSEGARQYNRAARELKRKFPGTEIIIVPKCREAIPAIDDNIVLGYPMGYSDKVAEEYTNIVDWRERRVHLLGASPPKQYEAIQSLTQPRVTGEPPADIVGVDWNGIHLAALKGQYFTPHGYGDADHLSIRATVRESLEWIRRYWQTTGVWPTSGTGQNPLDEEPMDPVFVADGGRATTTELEDAIVVEYGNGQTLAYRSERERKRIEYREGLVPVNRT